MSLPLGHFFEPHSVSTDVDGRLRQAMKATIPRAPAVFGRRVGSALYWHFG
jgi:hypothetical protein